MDVVYVIGPKSRDGHAELRYSLRSVAANLTHGRVWVAGHLPGWVRGVGHIPTAQDGSKYANSTANLLTAARHPEVAESFAYFNDDFYCLQPTEVIPPAHRGPVHQLVNGYRRAGRRLGAYFQGALGTAQLLADLGYPAALSYELHRPMTLGKQRLVEVLELAAPAQIAALHKRTLYGNYWRIGGEQVDDCKVARDRDAWSADWQWLSTTEASFGSGRVGRWLQDRFPEPCRYEEG